MCNHTATLIIGENLEVAATTTDVTGCNFELSGFVVPCQLFCALAHISVEIPLDWPLLYILFRRVTQHYASRGKKECQKWPPMLSLEVYLFIFLIVVVLGSFPFFQEPLCRSEMFVGCKLMTCCSVTDTCYSYSGSWQSGLGHSQM